MCYKVESERDKKKLSEKLIRKNLDESSSSQVSIGFEHPTLLIIKAGQSFIEPEYSTWGLEPSHGYNTLNAKVETVRTSPLYKPFSNNRCLLPVDAIYEWQHIDKDGKPAPKSKKTRQFRISGDKLLFLGGIYSDMIDHETGEVKSTFTLLTRPAEGIMTEIHNSKLRMPFILNNPEEWLTGSKGEILMDLKAQEIAK